MKEAITQTLMETFSAEYVHVVDDSAKHKSHRPDSENSHFNILIVSQAFDGLSLVKRHRLLYDALDPFIQKGVHALQLKPLTCIEFEEIVNG